jgi:2-oxoglutarate ferredoxin oxidoreductase subunit alpha
LLKISFIPHAVKEESFASNNNGVWILSKAYDGGPMALDIIIRIGGQAGQGVQAVSYALGKIFTRNGYYVLIHRDVESRIRGGITLPR